MKKRGEAVLILTALCTAALICTAGCKNSNETNDIPDAANTANTVTDVINVTENTEKTAEPIEQQPEEAVMTVLPKLSGTRSDFAPDFSAQSGCYPDEFVLTVAVPEGYTCYYTLDGSSPLDTGMGFVYSAEGISINDRTGEPNVVNAVPTAMYDAANVRVSADKKGFTTTSRNPSDETIDKCTVVRAVLVDENGSAGSVVTRTYFVGDLEDHVSGAAASARAAKEAGMGSSLAVISITGNYEDFFGYETGIYVKGKLYDDAIAELVAAKTKLDNDTSRRIAANYNQKGRDWERCVHIDFFEADENGLALGFEQDCGIRIQGNYSRSDLQKGFRLYARSDYGAKNFKYPVFGDAVQNAEGETLEKYKSLILRNGGNCAFTTKWSADYWAYMASGLQCETMASRPAVVYLNGEYWGLYVLEENYSQDYFADKRGVNKGNVVLYKGDAESEKLGYKLDLGELPPEDEGEDYYFRSLLDFFDTHTSLESDEDYAEFCSLVDPESVRDYFAVEVWINNKWDWPGKNWSMWRVACDDEIKGQAGARVSDDSGNIYADGRWRFCFYDLEFGGVSGAGDSNVNTVKEDNYKTYGLLDMNTDNPAVLCFAYCMTNESFRKDFYNRLGVLSKVIFMNARAQAVLDDFTAVYEPLYDQFFLAYPGTGSTKNSITGGYASKQCISDFLTGRYGYIDKIVEWCDKVLAR